jgi:hypothetical protein
MKKMSMISFTRRAAGSLLLGATLMSTASFAQDERIAEGLKRLPVLPCCQCIGKEGASLDLSTGAAVWSAILPGGANSATQNASNPAWTPTTLAPANWISPTSNPTTVGTYTYSIRFDARRCVIPSSITITGKYLADNKGTLLVDGRPVATQLGTPNYGFLPGSVTPFSYTIPAAQASGLHTITLQAENSGGPTGVVVQLSVRRNCDGPTEIQGDPKN